MKITITVKQKTDKSGTPGGWEGSYQLPNSTTAKLSRSDTKETLFPTRAALIVCARSLGKKLGWEVDFAEPAKKAAKKSLKKSLKKTAQTTY